MRGGAHDLAALKLDQTGTSARTLWVVQEPFALMSPRGGRIPIACLSGVNLASVLTPALTDVGQESDDRVVRPT